MPETRIPHDALVLVGDGSKALFLRNKGNPLNPRLVVERILEQENPATRHQGTDQPGRSVASLGGVQSAMDETDWHQLAEERFAAEIAEVLYRHAHARHFDKLVIVAPPKVLGKLRKFFHKEVTERIAAEVPKAMTSIPVPEIQRLLAS